MKPIFFPIATIIILSLSACSGENSNKPASHTHADGTLHEGATHSESGKTMPAQKSFKVEADSTKYEHEHDRDHSHDGHNHKH